MLYTRKQRQALKTIKENGVIQTSYINMQVLNSLVAVGKVEIMRSDACGEICRIVDIVVMKTAVELEKENTMRELILSELADSDGSVRAFILYRNCAKSAQGESSRIYEREMLKMEKDGLIVFCEGIVHFWKITDKGWAAYALI